MDKNNFKKIPQHLGKVAGLQGNLPIFVFLSSWVSSVKNIGYPKLQNSSKYFSWLKKYPSGIYSCPDSEETITHQLRLPDA